MLDDYGKDYFYEIYVTKHPAEEVIGKIKLFSAYEISKAEMSKRIVTYYDTPTNNLGSVDILLNTDVINGKGELTLERNLDKAKNVKYIRLLQTYKHTTPFTDKQSIFDFIPFLRDSLRTFFSQPLDFDADDMFKRVIPTYQFQIKNESYKIVNFSGFKCWVTIEDTTYINMANGRKNYVTYVKVSSAEDSQENDMADFIEKLEKYCKRINRTYKSKYSECVRLTRDIDEIIKKKKKFKNRKYVPDDEEEEK